ncbi:RraA family protein [Azorhizobium sp. AG788]|uniref:RraA family protein n=1 Tax=Azorhizobium sp. AG788 TaxID=2183897 RepID=UPI0031389BDE
MPSRATIAKALRALDGISPSTIGHVRQSGFMDCGIRALLPERRALGPAFTIRAPGADGAIIAHALGQAARGDVLVIDRCGERVHAAWGGVLAHAARVLGLAGVIIDGLICDPDELRREGVPVWHRGTTALTTRRMGIGGDIGRTVSCGGVPVRPGDIILADESGVLVLPADEALATAATAHAMQAREAVTRARIDAGESMAAIAGTAALFAKTHTRIDTQT